MSICVPKGLLIKHLLVLALLLFSVAGYSQSDIFRRIPRPGSGGGGGGDDSLQKRNSAEDSITITFRYLDSSRLQRFDSSITDFSRRYPSPWHNVHLGNIGNASRNLLFSPRMISGFDPGFHAYDVYLFRADETKFYNTTRPYSEIAYVLGSRIEQMIGLTHTQNIMPNWNAAFEYRLITSPGFFQNQATNHNNYRFSSWYQSRNKRYQNFFVIVGNKLQSGENGGIRTDQNYLDTIGFSDRSTIPTQLGPISQRNVDFLRPQINTGTRYTTGHYLLRQQYDVGQKDSIVTDSTVIPLFYPRLRFEHTLSYRTYNYRFADIAPDSLYYSNNYKIDDGPENFYIQDQWTDLTNDFSIYTFPDAKNPQQFFKAGAALQMLKGNFDTGTVSTSEYNFLVHGEYRNKTRNQKWDIEAFGDFYVNGYNAGDYQAYISLRRLVSKSLGYLQVGFHNTNRSPSFIYDTLSSFYLGTPRNFQKENITQLFGSIEQPRFKFKLTGRYFLVSNYLYFRNFREPDQSSSIFNLLQITAQKQFRLRRNWNWRTWVVLQQRAGDAPLNVPLLFTRNQVGYDGNLGFKNLNASFGLEFRYYTPYKGDNYSPLTGQFFFQDTTTIRMNVPEIGAYLHFRIRTFNAFIRIENLNAFDPSTGEFTNNNIVAPNYPHPGMQFRIGIFWSFIN
jgi:hypothetical protein